MIHLHSLMSAAMYLWSGRGTGDTYNYGDAGGFVMIILGILGLRHAAKLRALARKLEAIPFTSIAAAKSGPARVRGRVHSDALVTSPFSQTACCCYRAEVEDASDDGTSMGSGWTPLYTDVSKIGFVLEDASGSLKVRPQGLDIDIPFGFQHEVISKPCDAREKALYEYVEQNCPNKLNAFLLATAKTAFISPEQAADPRVQERLQKWEERRRGSLHKRTKGQSFRFREATVMPGQECEIAGTVESEDGVRVLRQGPEGMPFLLSANMDEALNADQQRRARNFARWSTAFVVGGVALMGLTIWTTW